MFINVIEIPASVATQFSVYPVSSDYHSITVAVFDPFDVDMEQTVRFVSSRTPVVQLSPPSAIKAAIASQYSPDQAAEDLLEPHSEDGSVHVVAATGPEDVDAKQAQSSPVVKLTNQIGQAFIFNSIKDERRRNSFGQGRIPVLVVMRSIIPQAFLVARHAGNLAILHSPQYR